MKSSKKVWFGVLGVAVMLVLIGVFVANRPGTDSDGNAPADDAASVTWYFDYMGSSFSDRGCFYKESNFLHFCDPESGQDVLICNKAQCQHKKDGKCPAFFEALSAYALIDGDKLLVISDEGETKFGNYGLFEMSLNGENRKKIGTITGVQNIHGIVVSDQWIFIAYKNRYNENLEPQSLTDTGILAYNRSAKEGRVIWSASGANAGISTIAYHGNAIYFTYLYYQMNEQELEQYLQDGTWSEENLRYEYRRVSLDGQEMCICDSVNDMTPWFCGEETFYNGMDGKMYAYHTETGQARQIADCLNQIPTYIDGMLLLQDMDSWKNIYLYREGTDELEKMDNVLEDVSPIVLFPTYLYVWDYSNGNGVLGFERTEECLKGNFSELHVFEKRED